MKELNHNHIDLLKIDIENIECDVFEKMLNDKIYPTYLSVDFDLFNHDRERCIKIIEKLLSNDYKILLNDLVKYITIITIINFLFYISKPNTLFWNMFYLDSISFLTVSFCAYHLIIKKLISF